MHDPWWLLSVFTVLWISSADGDLKVMGDISFDIHIMEPSGPRPRPQLKMKQMKQPEQPPAQEPRELAPRAHANNVTAPPPAACVYQYPEPKQVDALLSNMMNKLTNMFIRVPKSVSSRARGGEQGKRFKVVASKKSHFFDHVYANMTEEYRRFVNKSRARAQRHRDPCSHQNEIRDVWRELLDFSQDNLRRAAVACVEQYLRVSRAEGDEDEEEGGRARGSMRAARAVGRELARVRQDQLDLLCDRFQLCFHELQ